MLNIEKKKQKMYFHIIKQCVIEIQWINLRYQWTPEHLQVLHHYAD